MAMKTELVDQSKLGIKVEGDLGDLQIIEELNESDDEVQGDTQKVNTTVANIPNNLVQASTTPVFGSVAVTNSENVQFGNNTFFNGPVTIKQVIQTSSGIDNASYQNTEDEKIPNGKYSSKENPSSSYRFKIKPWHKLSISVLLLVLISIACVVVVITQQGDQEKSSTSAASANASDGTSSYAQVMVLCRDNVEIILWVLCVPITFLMWVFYSLLTNEATSYEEVILKNENDISPTISGFKYEGDDLLIAPDHLRIVSRTDWLAQPVEGSTDVLRLPAPWVIITHTATEGCTTQSSCVLRVRQMQTFHIESKGWSDIAYNFLIGGDGSAYYGRGWDIAGAHTKGYNKYSIAIAFIGTYNTESPTKNQVEACKKLIKLGVAEGKIAKNYKLFAHRQLMSTLSPGDKLFEIIKTWPHFVTETDLTSLLPNY